GPATGPAISTALAGWNGHADGPGHRNPGNRYATTVGRTKQGVFLRLGDHRPKCLNVEPRGVAVHRVAPVLATPRPTEVLQPDAATRAGVRDHRARHRVPGVDLQARKFVVRHHQVPNLVVLPRDDPIITIPHNARLNKSPPGQE